MEYKCHICNYCTELKGNYTRHITSAKHIEKNNLYEEGIKNIKNAYENEKQVLIDKYENLKTYYEDIIKNLKQTHANKIKKLKLIISSKDTEIKMKDDLIKSKDNELKVRNTAIEPKDSKKDTVVKNMISTVSFIQNNYTNAPVLQVYDDLINQISDDTIQLCESILIKHNMKKLHSDLGDIIVGRYKKENPEDQSIWTTDCSRLNYLVRSIVYDKPTWIKDLNGEHLKKFIIDNILDTIINEVGNYMVSSTGRNYNRNLDYTTKNNIWINLQIEINTGVMADRILRHIAPFFVMNVKYIDNKN